MISCSWEKLSRTEGKRIEALGCITFFCWKRFSLVKESELGAVLLRHKAFISNSAFYTLLMGAAGKPAWGRVIAFELYFLRVPSFSRCPRTLPLPPLRKPRSFQASSSVHKVLCGLLIPLLLLFRNRPGLRAGRGVICFSMFQ